MAALLSSGGNISLSSFRGVWRRTELYEPRGTLGPDNERKKIVLWIQSKSGIFIDIRVCPDSAHNINPRNLKSFAGIGSYDQSLERFTWTRLLDFRPPGSPDVGKMTFTSQSVIEEDGVLPGDDFREIWTQQLEGKYLETDDDVVYQLRSGCGKRRGYFIIVGDYFGFTLSRDDSLSPAKLRRYFDAEISFNELELELLMSHACVIGKTYDWRIIHSLDNSAIGQCILPGQAEISCLLSSLQWEAREGLLPDELVQHIDSGGKFLSDIPGGIPETERCYRGIRIPKFFQCKTADMFALMDTKYDDIFISSLPKGGTTWTNRIVSVMTTNKYDDNGDIRSDYIPPLNNVMVQVYPESLVLENSGELENGTISLHENLCFDDLLMQKSPRLFSTHLFGDFLPHKLIDPNGQGKLIIVLRNLKDTLTSLHFFRGEAKDGWTGNEHGPGSFARYIAEDCTNGYGSAFNWIAQNDAIFNQLKDTGRVYLLYFEDLKRDLSGQLGALYSFLGLGSLSAKKCEAIAREVGFKEMKKCGGWMNSLLRKGEVGDWKNYMTIESWSELDDVFERKLGDIGIAAPLRQYHMA